MDFKKQKISLSEVKEMDLVNYLSSLGHEPTKQRNQDFWYHSPLREENTPSFKVNRMLNKWYDHGIGKGGNTIDFAIQYHQCTVAELLQLLSNGSPLPRPFYTNADVKLEAETKIVVIENYALHSHALLKYLNQRQIPLVIANEFCREVRYTIHDKTYFGIGFKNDSGAWEIRNPYFKSGSSPKDISTFKTGADEVLVFEGFMDFLSYKTLQRDRPELNQDVVVLNSVSFFEKARPFMEEHHSIHLYLDRDATGRQFTQRALSLDRRYRDESKLYSANKDLNEWLISTKKVPKKRLGRGIR